MVGFGGSVTIYAGRFLKKMEVVFGRVLTGGE